MSQVQYEQTFGQWREWLANGKDVSAMMLVYRSVFTDFDAYTKPVELSLTGRVEFNDELDSYEVIGLYATDRSCEEVDLNDEEHAQAVANLIKAYFEEVGL